VYEREKNWGGGGGGRKKKFGRIFLLFAPLIKNKFRIKFTKFFSTGGELEKYFEIYIFLVFSTIVLNIVCFTIINPPFCSTYVYNLPNFTVFWASTLSPPASCVYVNKISQANNFWNKKLSKSSTQQNLKQNINPVY
jgi:hypothetical protein